jgi:predicted PurR-regulated permease PerM
VLTARNYVWIAGAAIVIFLGLRYLGPVLTPFLIGAILAYLGTPIVQWAEGGASRAGSRQPSWCCCSASSCSRCSWC